jgi:hypothetical protein
MSAHGDLEVCWTDDAELGIKIITQYLEPKKINNDTKPMPKAGKKPKAIQIDVE